LESADRDSSLIAKGALNFAIVGAGPTGASADADYITGATIVVDGGLTWNYSEQ
jgi:hypothetical protein